MDINKLRAMRNDDFSKISQEFEKTANPQSQGSQRGADERFWRLDPDKAGNASAVIRFLPRVEGDELPWVRMFNHGFQGPQGKWYIENSLTTIGEKDPVGELNSALWNNGTEAGKDQARKQKRRLSYIANIYVVSDPKHPENEGKVFLFKFGKKIFDKIMDKARPTFEDEKPVNVFDLWEGANFRLRMRKVSGYANYDESLFAEPSQLADGEEDRLLDIVSRQYALTPFISPDQFKSFEELSRHLQNVLSGEGAPQSRAADVEEVAENFVAPQPRSAPAPQMESRPAPEPKEAAKSDDEDVMSYFERIANED